MNLAKLLQTGTPVELREVGELLLQLADAPRDAGWQAMIAATLDRFQTPEELNFKAIYERMKRTDFLWMEKLEQNGVGHSQLLTAELARRGDARTLNAYLADVVGGAHASDVQEAFALLGRQISEFRE
jgi:hypothetical protein